jgi:hypothetical protein
MDAPVPFDCQFAIISDVAIDPNAIRIVLYNKEVWEIMRDNQTDWYVSSIWFLDLFLVCFIQQWNYSEFLLLGSLLTITGQSAIRDQRGMKLLGHALYTDFRDTEFIENPAIVTDAEECARRTKQCASVMAEITEKRAKMGRATPKEAKWTHGQFTLCCLNEFQQEVFPELFADRDVRIFFFPNRNFISDFQD